MWEAATICPAPCKLTFDLLTLFASRVTWATSMAISVFLSLSVLDLGPIYATDRQADVRQTSDTQHRLMPPLYGGGGITTCGLVVGIDTFEQCDLDL